MKNINFMHVNISADKQLTPDAPRLMNKVSWQPRRAPASFVRDLFALVRPDPELFAQTHTGGEESLRLFHSHIQLSGLWQIESVKHGLSLASVARPGRSDTPGDGRSRPVGRSLAGITENKRLKGK